MACGHAFPDKQGRARKRLAGTSGQRPRDIHSMARIFQRRALGAA